MGDGPTARFAPGAGGSLLVGLWELADQIKDMQCGAREAVLRSDRLLGASKSLSFSWWRLLELTSIPPRREMPNGGRAGTTRPTPSENWLLGNLHSLGRCAQLQGNRHPVVQEPTSALFRRLLYLQPVPAAAGFLLFIAGSGFRNHKSAT